MKRKSLKKWLLFLGGKNLNLCFLKKLRKKYVSAFLEKMYVSPFLF